MAKAKKKVSRLDPDRNGQVSFAIPPEKREKLQAYVLKRKAEYFSFNQSDAMREALDLLLERV